MTLLSKLSALTGPDREVDAAIAAAVSVLDALSAEQIGTYKRAFVERGGDFIILDGWSRSWQWDDVHQLTKLGLMVFDEATSEQQSNEQYTAQVYRPSPDFLAALQDLTTTNRDQP